MDWTSGVSVFWPDSDAVSLGVSNASFRVSCALLGHLMPIARVLVSVAWSPV